MIPIIILSIENDDDRDFISSLYLELHPLMKSTALHIVKDINIAEDVIQDSLVSIIRKIDTIRSLERRKLTAYVVRTVQNKAFNYYNKHQKDMAKGFYDIDGDSADSVIDDTYAPSEWFDMLETYEELGNAIKSLSERDRHLLFIKYNMELSDHEIAEIIGIKKDSVRQYLTRARRNALAVMTKWGNSFGEHIYNLE